MHSAFFSYIQRFVYPPFRLAMGKQFKADDRTHKALENSKLRIPFDAPQMERQSAKA
jgi:hypothetical protein